MRVILKLKAKASVSQKLFYQKYYSSTNGWFYKKVSSLHDKAGIKFFCFSNLIGIKEEKIELNEIYTVIFSFAEPDTAYKFVTSLGLGENIGLGEFQFELVKTKFDKLVIKENMILETPTIIVVEENIKTKEGKSKRKSINYLEEQKKYIDLLEKNILHKYNLLTSEDSSKKYVMKDREGHLFDNIEINPITYTKKVKEDKGQNKGHFAIPVLRKEGSNNFIPFYGNKLEFKIGKITEEQKIILSKVIDAGFGMYNSYGMGFIIERRGHQQK